MRYQAAALSVAEHLPSRLRNGRNARPTSQTVGCDIGGNVPYDLPDVQWRPPSFDDLSVLGTQKGPAITLPPFRYLENADAPRVFLHPGNDPHRVSRVVHPGDDVIKIPSGWYLYLPRSASYTAEPTLPYIYFFHKKEAGVSLRQIIFGDGRHFIASLSTSR